MAVDEQQSMGHRIRDAHQRCGEVPVATLAQLVNLDVTEMVRIFEGTRSLSSVELAVLADALGVDPYWIITGDPDPLAVRMVAACRVRVPGETDFA